MGFHKNARTLAAALSQPRRNPVHVLLIIVNESSRLCVPSQNVPEDADARKHVLKRIDEEIGKDDWNSCRFQLPCDVVGMATGRKAHPEHRDVRLDREARSIENEPSFPIPRTGTDSIDGNLRR